MAAALDRLSMVDVTSLVPRINEYTLVLPQTGGGPVDADGLRKGAIVDPGGPAFLISTAPPSSPVQMPVTAPQKLVSLSNISPKSASLSATGLTPGAPVTVTASVGTGNRTSVVGVYVNGLEEAQQDITVNSGGYG